MITAYNKLKANFYNGSFIEINSGDVELIQELMIEFAKLHVTEALKAALENSPTGSSTDIPSYEDMKNVILNAYPLDQIK